MQVLTKDNLNEILNIIVYNSFLDLNNFLDADNVYTYILNINDNLEEFLDFIYEDKLTNYILDIDKVNLTEFHNTLINNIHSIAKNIIL